MYNPPFKITDEMLMLVSSISEKIGNITTLSALDKKPHLRKNNRIASIYSSLKIEANSLTFSQVNDVIDGKLVLGDKKEIQEVKNAYAAYELIPPFNPYSIEDLKRAHGIMTKYLLFDSGNFRKGEEGVFQGDTCIFMAPPAQHVPLLMDDLFEWLNKNRNSIHPLIFASIFHYEFVFIHPFSDGNGRIARLWHTVLLSKWKDIFTYIPLESQIEKFQDEYYKSIAKCHVEGESTTFILFILKQLNALLETISKEYNGRDTTLPIHIQKLLSVMIENIPYTSYELMEKLDLKSKEGFRRNYIVPAMKLGLIQMTIPDKPNSRNQRYIKI